MGVPARGGVPADKPTGLKTSELRAGAGSVAKAAAYVNQQMVRGWVQAGWVKRGVTSLSHRDWGLGVCFVGRLRRPPARWRSS
jgi:hypothetical protein